eukprot:scpid98879/ scgid15521/ 
MPRKRAPSASRALSMSPTIGLQRTLAARIHCDTAMLRAPACANNVTGITGGNGQSRIRIAHVSDQILLIAVFTHPVLLLACCRRFAHESHSHRERDTSTGSTPVVTMTQLLKGHVRTYTHTHHTHTRTH